MKTLAISFTRGRKFSLLLDFIALVFVYFVPTLSHLLNLPVYLIEPMRLMLVLSIIHTHKYNAYILAITLPLFSYLVSGHPYILKIGLISAELVLNVWLFYTFDKYFRSAFFSMLSAIVASKIIYYLLKASLISLAFIHTELFSTPLLIQVIMTLLFSGYALIRSRKAA